MKLKYQSDRGLHFVAEYPDEELKRYWTNKIVDAIANEQAAFAQEVAVALRKLPAGKKMTIKSKPIIVVIEKESTKPTGTPL